MKNDNYIFGRPTKYHDGLIKEVDVFLEKCKDEKYNYLKTDGANSSSYEEKIRVNIPSKEKFAKHIGVAVSTIYEWNDKYKDFSEALKKIDICQRYRLIDNGLSGHYNSTIVKLMLCTNHGFSDKTENKLNGKLETNSYVSFLDEYVENEKGEGEDNDI